MPFFIKINFQDYNNKSIINIGFFNDEMNIVITIILSTILYIIITIKTNKSIKNNRERSFIEIFWTFLPVLIIFFISIPSIISLYLFEEIRKPSKFFFITGNQWYWRYKNIIKIKFNSYITQRKINRNLSTDYSLLLNSKKINRLIFSSNDVIHSWSLPSRITKIDCVPGRINSTNIQRTKIIKAKGQCSEICGSNHRFIPISVLFFYIKVISFLH